MAEAEFETIQLDRKGPIGILTLNRPDKLNAINPQMRLDVGAALAADLGAFMDAVTAEADDDDGNTEFVREAQVDIVVEGDLLTASVRLIFRDLDGVEVLVGLRPGSRSRAAAEGEGLTVVAVDEAARRADVVMLLAPDTEQARIYAESIAPHLADGQTLMFAHGFDIRYGTIEPPKDVDVTMVAPKSPGHRVRETYQEGGGVPALADRRPETGR